MAWTHTPDGLCELKAIAPAPVRRAGARSGLSSRTPPPLRQADARILDALQSQVTQPAEPMPLRSSTNIADPAVADDGADDSGLLGGIYEGAPPSPSGVW